MKCSMEGCEREAFARGLCGSHYQKLRKSGEMKRITKPAGERTVRGLIRSRFAEYIIKEASQRNVTRKAVIQELAEHLDLKFDSLYALYQGTVLPSLPVALKIAEHYQVRVEDIFTLERGE